MGTRPAASLTLDASPAATPAGSPEASDAPLLRLERVVRRHPGASRAVLDGVDLEVRRGEAFAVLGPSGSGKSSLLRAVAGLDEIDAGRIERPERPGAVVLVPQRPALLPWRTVRENVELGARFASTRERVTGARVDALLEVLGIAELADRLPCELSGGQAQRVAFGRALAVSPSLLLLDEPFSALDVALRGALRSWLRGLITELRLTVLLVTHDIDEAVDVADHVGYFDGSGRFADEWIVADEPDLRERLLARFGGVAGT